MNNQVNINAYSAVVQTQASEKVSNAYAFIPTTSVLEVLQDHGWEVSKVMQAGSRVHNGFQKHLVRLKHREFSSNIHYPELVLTNSHMGTSAFKLMLGVYRLICGNGMIIGDTYQTHTIKHLGYTAEKVEFAITHLLEYAPRVLDTIDKWQGQTVTRGQELAMAESAIEMVKNGEKWRMAAGSVVAARRYEDRAVLSGQNRSLWTAFNVMQENFIKGGIRRLYEESGRVSRSRAIKSVDENIRINKGLWEIADKTSQVLEGF